MAQYSVQERISKAISAAVALLILLGVWFAVASSFAVFDTPIGQLTISRLVFPAIWFLILMACVQGVAELLFEAIVGRDQLRKQKTAEADAGPPPPGPRPEAPARPAVLPAWLRRGNGGKSG